LPSSSSGVRTNPDRLGGPCGTGKLAPYATVLVRTVEAQPDITIPDLAARLWHEHGVIAAPAALSRLLCRRGLIYKNS
jgi:hypothetical protein